MRAETHLTKPPDGARSEIEFHACTATVCSVGNKYRHSIDSKHKVLRFCFGGRLQPMRRQTNPCSIEIFRAWGLRGILFGLSLCVIVTSLHF